MSLDDQAQARKERLALLKSAKRKREGDISGDLLREEDEAASKMQYRNYDPESKAPKLGFLSNPAGDLDDTLEKRASALIQDTLEAENAAAAAASADATLDLSTIQPKNPNSDLKRRLNEKLAKLRERQSVIVANLVREKILASRAISKEDGLKDGQDISRQVALMEKSAREISGQS